MKGFKEDGRVWDFILQAQGSHQIVFEKARDRAKGNCNKFTLIEELHMPYMGRHQEGDELEAYNVVQE